MKRCRGSCLVRPERDPETDVTTMKTIKSLRATLARVALTAGAALATQAALAVNSLPGGPAVNQLDLHPPVTQIAADQRWLHYFMLVICTVIFVAVFGVMFYSIFKHRKSKGAVSANFHESVKVEIAWTVVPLLIVIGMALPATKTVVAMKDTSSADLTIKAQQEGAVAGPVPGAVRGPAQRDVSTGR